MSKPKYLWHAYVRAILKKYPNVSNKEKKAVEDAISEFSMAGKSHLLDLIEIYYFKEKCDMRGVAKALYVSESTPIRWNKEIMRKVAANLGLME